MGDHNPVLQDKDIPPWRLTNIHAIGGLEAVGFERSSEELIVASSRGQGIFDCSTGEKIFRDPERSGYCWKTLNAQRLDKDSSPKIPMMGLHGGGLRTVTDDGWVLNIVHADPELKLQYAPQARLSHLLLNAPGDWTYIARAANTIATDIEFRVWGFSWTGNSFVWSDEVDLRLYARMSD